MTEIYKALNYFFFIFHTSLILFNCSGWIFRKTRHWNLLTLLATAFNWFVLGFFYGWGFCLCTEWHWQVRHHLGYYDMSNSYNHFLLLKLTGINFSPMLIDSLTAAVFFFSLAISLWLNIRDNRKK